MENDSELVLERIMEDGTFDELRKRIVERVKQDVWSWTSLASIPIGLHIFDAQSVLQSCRKS